MDKSQEPIVSIGDISIKMSDLTVKQLILKLGFTSHVVAACMKMFQTERLTAEQALILCVYVEDAQREAMVARNIELHSMLPYVPGYTIGTPRIVVNVSPGVAGEPVIISITCWDNDQEITVPAGWKLEKECRHFNQNKYQAVISRVRTDTLGATVVISLKNDTLATAHIVDRDYKIAPY